MSNENDKIIFESIDSSTNELVNILKDARNNVFLKGCLNRIIGRTVTVIRLNGEIAGISLPLYYRKKDSYRLGILFIDEKHRKKGLAEKFVKHFFKGKNGFAFVDNKNLAAIRLFEKCDFVKEDKKTGKVSKWIKDA